MEITYDYYRIFYYVAKYKSFSNAARTLGSNQPNITRYINNLESQLHCKLFIRSNRGVTLTPEGEKLFVHVEIAYEHLREAEMALADDKSLQSGSVSIGSCETALHGILLPVLERFHALYPGIRLTISNLSSSQALQTLRDSVADFAVVTTPAHLLPNFKATTLASFHDLLVGSRQYASLREEPLSFADLLEYPLIGLGKGTITYEFYTQLFLENGLVWKLAAEVGTTNQLLPMIECNLGIGFVPDFLAQDAVSAGRVFSLPLCSAVPERRILLVEDKTRPLSIAANTLRKMLVEQSKHLLS